jgi:hypothetical protein
MKQNRSTTEILIIFLDWDKTSKERNQHDWFQIIRKSNWSRIYYDNINLSVEKEIGNDDYSSDAYYWVHCVQQWSCHALTS